MNHSLYAANHSLYAALVEAGVDQDKAAKAAEGCSPQELAIQTHAALIVAIARAAELRAELIRWARFAVAMLSILILLGLLHAANDVIKLQRFLTGIGP